MTTEQAYRICVVLTGFTVLGLTLLVVALMHRVDQLARRLDRRPEASEPQLLRRRLYPPVKSVVVSRQLEDVTE